MVPMIPVVAPLYTETWSPSSATAPVAFAQRQSPERPTPIPNPYAVGGQLGARRLDPQVRLATV